MLWSYRIWYPTKVFYLSHIYIIDIWSDCLRRQSNEEMVRNIWTVQEEMVRNNGWRCTMVRATLPDGQRCLPSDQQKVRARVIIGDQRLVL
jgi:hypothetical protein